MSIVYIGSATGGAINGGNATISLSGITGIATGDFVVVASGGYNRSSGVGGVVTDGTGSLTEPVNTVNGNIRFRVNHKFVNGDTTLTIAGSGNAADSVSGIAMVFRNVDTTTPLDATSTTATGSSTNPNPPSITPTNANDCIVALAGSLVNDSTPGTITTFSPGTAVFNNQNDTNAITVAGQYKILTSSSATDPAAFSSWSTGAWVAATLALKLAPLPAGTVFDESAQLAGTDDGHGDEDHTFRLEIPSAQLVSATGNRARVTLLWGSASSSDTAAVTDMFIGQGAATGNAYDFANTPTRVTFGGANTANSSPGGTVTSDWVTLPETYDNTKNLVVSWYIDPAMVNTSMTTVSSGGGCGLWYKAFANEAANKTVVAGGYTSAGSDIGFLVSRVEIQASATGAAGASTGTGSASAIGSAKFSGVGSGVGTSSASAVYSGTGTAQGVGASTGSGVSIGVGTSNASSAGSSTGSGTSSGAGSSISGWAPGQLAFSSSSSWNTPIPAGSTYTSVSWPASTGFNYSVAWDAYSPAVYVSGSGDPTVAVTCPAGWGWSANPSLKVPVGVTGAAGTDGEVVIVDGDTVWSFWQFSRTSNTTATASSYAKTSISTGTGWGTTSPWQAAGTTAAGSSLLAGLLVQAETDTGTIPHAVQLVPDGTLVKSGYVGEAINSDGSSGTGIVQEGQRLAIPPSTTMPSGLSTLGQIVFTAMKTYGAFVIDVASGVTNLRAQANAYDDPTLTNLWHDLGSITPLLQAVTLGTGTTTGVGSSTGSGAATGVGKSTSSVVGSSTGTSSAAAKSISSATGASAGSGSASATGGATDSALGSSGATSTVSGVGASIVSSAGSAAATSTAPAVAPSISAAVGSSVGSGASSAIGGSVAASIGNAIGAGQALAFSGTRGTATGTGTATASGAASSAAPGTSTGTGSAIGAGNSIVPATGMSSSLSAANSNASSLSRSVGSATGDGTSGAVVIALFSAIGSASGTSSSESSGRSTLSAVGSSVATSDADSPSAALSCSAGSAYAFSPGNAIGSAVVFATGTSIGSSQADGVGVRVVIRVSYRIGATVGPQVIRAKVGG